LNQDHSRNDSVPWLLKYALDENYGLLLGGNGYVSQELPGVPTQQSFGDTAGHSGGIEDRRPWSDQSGGNLARDAGVNDIGSSGQRADNNDSGSRQGFFDQGSYDDDNDMDHDGDGFDDDGGGDGDYA